ncbi:uncharacterized protein VTP21DRAFT_7506 [Calcarisporiella thermophila]|uniref:uncharacterized protein n=1 Tax=Calcarisporiella thermophila TaxID=911321 RepID=UPI003744978F
MDQTVFETLGQTLSSDVNKRIAAELRLRELENVPDYAVSLANLVANPGIEIAHRQAAGIALKNYIDTHWTAKSERFRGPELPSAHKSIVRQTIFAGLSDGDSRIRVASAYVVSKIAHNDWPEEWPELAERLVEGLRGRPEEVHGAMRVLNEFVSNDMTDQQFPRLAPPMCAELHRIVASPTQYSSHTRARAVSIFRHCVDMVYTLKETYPDVTQFLVPIIDGWMEVFVGILQQQPGASSGNGQGEWYLRTEIVRTLNRLLNEFSKMISPYMMRVLEPVWMDLMHLREQFVLEHVRSDGETLEDEVDSDGETVGFEPLIYAEFDFLGSAARKKAAEPLFLGEQRDGRLLGEVIWVAISYMQMTEEQCETWAADPNRFVADEDDETFSFNVRIAAQDLLLNLLQRFPTALFAALERSVQRHLDEAAQEKQKGHGWWWKSIEASLLAIGRTAEELIEGLEEGSVAFDLKGLFDHIVLEHMRAEEFPFLQGRAFVFASQFAKILPGELASQYVAAAVHSLQHSSSAPVKVSALRAINNFCKYLDPQYFVTYQEQILEGVCGLVPLTTEDSLILVLEAMIGALRVSGERVAAYEHIIGPLLLDVWMKHSSDHIIAGIINELFEILASQPTVYSALRDRALPVMAGIIASNDAEPGVVASAIELVTSLVKGGPPALPDNLILNLFPSLMPRLMSTDDRTILQNGEECLKYIVQKGFSQLLQWHDASGRSGLHQLMDFVARLLHPEQSESAALFVGDLIVKLIQKGGEQLTPIMPQLLNAVVQRLAAATTPTFVQSLIGVFAHLLVNGQLETVVAFLSEVTVREQSGLEIVMRLWCENFENFHGYYDIKVNAIALSKLLLSHDPRLANIHVQGDLIVPQDPSANLIKTRSRARQNPDQYTVIPLPAKITKLLAVDFLSHSDLAQPGFSARGGADEEGEEDGGEWEDFDESPFAPAEDFAYLSDLLETGEAEFGDEGEDAEDDPEVKASPIYTMDIKEFYVDLFKRCSQESWFGELCSGYLSSEERERLARAVGQV